MEAAAEERYHAEVQHAYKELLHMEDWSGASRDRFLGVRPNTAFEQRLKQASQSNSNSNIIFAEFLTVCSSLRLITTGGRKLLQQIAKVLYPLPSSLLEEHW